MRTKSSHLALAFAIAVCVSLRPSPTRPRENDNPSILHFSRRSEILSAFWGRDMFLETGVVLPPGHAEGRPWPVCYSFKAPHAEHWPSGMLERIHREMRERVRRRGKV